MYKNLKYKDFLITSDKSQMNLEDIHNFLSQSYWAPGIPMEIVKSAFDNSYCAGLIKENRQIGYARIITDYSTFAYLCDLYILEEFRGKGLSKKLMEFIMEEPWIKQLRSIMLNTKDAHGLYEKFGFLAPSNPEKIMVKRIVSSYTGN